MSCDPTDFSCILAAGAGGVNISQATSPGYQAVQSKPDAPQVFQPGNIGSMIGSFLGTIGGPFVGQTPNEGAASGADAGGSLFSGITGTASAAASTVGFLTNPTRLIVTVLGLLLIFGGVITLRG